MLKARNQPFVLVFWSRDPDGTQHNQGDSLNAVDARASTARPRSPRSRMPTTICTQIRAGAERPRPRRRRPTSSSAADHGFSTISKESYTSAAAKGGLSDDVPKGILPSGLPRDRSSPRRSPCRCSIPDSKNAAGRRQRLSEPRQRPDRPGSGQARCRGRGERRLGPDLSAKQGSRDGASASSASCCSRTMSAGCSSTTAWAVIPARCRSRRSI